MTTELRKCTATESTEAVSRFFSFATTHTRANRPSYMDIAGELEAFLATARTVTGVA